MARNFENHKEFYNEEYWRKIPAWSNVSEEEFGSHLWQARHSLQKIDKIKEVLGERLDPKFLDDILEGQKITPMNIRITPYVFALIDWDNPVDDPLRKQFLPIASQFIEDHPFCLNDSLHEDVDSPVELLTHRYPDKVLFLPLTTCPVYCSYCTRSRVVGGTTENYEKDTYGTSPKKWEAVFEYLRNTPAVEDVVISGGDSYNLQAKQIEIIGKSLLDIPSIRRIRFATKGIAIYPQKILTDEKWVKAISDVYNYGKERYKQVVIHTHFSSPLEITNWTKMAMERLTDIGIIVRNQAVLQNGVNNQKEIMIYMTKKLSYLNVQPYYVYNHDMVPGCEHFRTPLSEGIELEKAVRGTTAGFNTPTFVTDLPKGGGKRHISSYEHYNAETGISVWRAPEVKPGEHFLYFDPIHNLSKEVKEAWKSESGRNEMVKAALREVGIS